MTIVKAAAVQISPVLYSREGTIEKVVDSIASLGRRGVQFAVYPETIVPYYPYFSFVQRPFENGTENVRLLEQGVTVPSHATDAIASRCQTGRNGGRHRRKRARRRYALQHAASVRRRRYA